MHVIPDYNPALMKSPSSSTSLNNSSPSSYSNSAFGNSNNTYGSNNKSSPTNFTPANFPIQVFPPPIPDLGFIDTRVGGETLKDFMPRGILVAHLHEHKSSVNQIEVSEDNMFFVTGINR